MSILLSFCAYFKIIYLLSVLVFTGNTLHPYFHWRHSGDGDLKGAGFFTLYASAMPAYLPRNSSSGSGSTVDEQFRSLLRKKLLSRSSSGTNFVKTSDENSKSETRNWSVKHIPTRLSKTDSVNSASSVLSQNRYDTRLSFNAKYGSFRSNQATAAFQCAKRAFEKGGQDVTEVFGSGTASLLYSSDAASSSEASTINQELGTECTIAGIQSLFDESFVQAPLKSLYSPFFETSNGLSPEVGIPYYNFPSWSLFTKKMLNSMYEDITTVARGAYGRVFAGNLLFDRYRVSTPLRQLSSASSISSMTMDDIILSEPGSPSVSDAGAFDIHDEQADKQSLAKKNSRIAIKLQSISSKVREASAAYQELKAYALLERLHEERLSPFFVQPLGVYFVGISKSLSRSANPSSEDIQALSLQHGSYDDATPLRTLMDLSSSADVASPAHNAERYMALEMEYVGMTLHRFITESIKQYRARTGTNVTPKLPPYYMLEMIVGEYGAIHFSQVNVYDRHSNNYGLSRKSLNDSNVYLVVDENASVRCIALVSRVRWALRRMDVGTFETCEIKASEQDGLYHNSCLTWRSRVLGDTSEPTPMHPITGNSYFTKKGIAGKVSSEKKRSESDTALLKGPQVDRQEFREQFRAVLGQFGLEDDAINADSSIAAKLASDPEFSSAMNSLASQLFSKSQCPHPSLIVTDFDVYGSPWFEFGCRYCSAEGRYGDICSTGAKLALVELLWARNLDSVIKRYFSSFVVKDSENFIDEKLSSANVFSVPSYTFAN